MRLDKKNDLENNKGCKMKFWHDLTTDKTTTNAYDNKQNDDDIQNKVFIGILYHNANQK